METVLKVVLFIVIFGFFLLIGPYLVLLGWNCARELWPELPVATYHHAFWITHGLAILIKSGGGYNRKKED